MNAHQAMLDELDRCAAQSRRDELVRPAATLGVGALPFSDLRAYLDEVNAEVNKMHAAVNAWMAAHGGQPPALSWWGPWVSFANHDPPRGLEPEDEVRISGWHAFYRDKRPTLAGLLNPKKVWDTAGAFELEAARLWDKFAETTGDKLASPRPVPGFAGAAPSSEAPWLGLVKAALVILAIVAVGYAARGVIR